MFSSSLLSGRRRVLVDRNGFPCPVSTPKPGRRGRIFMGIASFGGRRIPGLSCCAFAQPSFAPSVQSRIPCLTGPGSQHGTLLLACSNLDPWGDLVRQTNPSATLPFSSKRTHAGGERGLGAEQKGCSQVWRGDGLQNIDRCILSQVMGMK